jgi:hypothetical protein
VHADGSPVTIAQVPLHLRRARLTRLGFEINGEYCREFLARRYAETLREKETSRQEKDHRV